MLGALGLLVCGMSPLGVWLARPLEGRFPLPAADMAAPTGIIVLGGSMDQLTTAARGQPTIGAAPGRMTEAVALAGRFPEARLVFTGGSAAVLDAEGDEAAAARAVFLQLGIPPERITLERESRNTYENAVLTKAIVQPKPGERWLLVTSAWHMPRSVGIFRQAGWPVIPYPTDYETRGRRANSSAPSCRSAAASTSPTASPANGWAFSLTGSAGERMRCFRRRDGVSPGGGRSGDRRRGNRWDPPACPCAG